MKQHEKDSKMKTKVIFKKFQDGDIVALFPEEIHNKKHEIMSYQRIGQHGAASIDLITELEPANETEYYKLWTELLVLGYKLEVLDNYCKDCIEARKEGYDKCGDCSVPWCHRCSAQSPSQCDCRPIADNS